MNNGKPSPLIAQIKEILSNVDDSLEDEDKLSMVKGYWDAGRLAVEYKDSTGMLLKDIARQVDIPVWSLQRYTQFYKTFPNGYQESYGARRAARWSSVKTYKLGQYGRYTVDIYYLAGEADPETIAESGKLLNQVLVDKGLARKVE